MSQFVKKLVEYDGVESPVLVGNATLESPIGTTVLENSNGNGYRLATISFDTPSGKRTELPAQIWNGTLARMEESNSKFIPGQKYLTQLRHATDDEGNTKLFATMSHLRTADVNEEAVNELLAVLTEDVEQEVAAEV